MPCSERVGLRLSVTLPSTRGTSIYSWICTLSPELPTAVLLKVLAIERLLQGAQQLTLENSGYQCAQPRINRGVAS